MDQLFLYNDVTKSNNSGKALRYRFLNFQKLFHQTLHHVVRYLLVKSIT